MSSALSSMPGVSGRAADAGRPRARDPQHPVEPEDGVRRPSRLRRGFGVVTDPDSYRALAYLLLGLPLGTLWFSALVTGVSVAASLVVVALVGVPMLVVLWYVTRASANVERAVANSLLHLRLPYAPAAPPYHGNPWQRLRTMSREPARWREFGYLLLRFPVGVATFTAATTVLATPLMVAWAPVHARIDEHPFGTWALSSRMEDVAASPWAWLFVPLGALLVVAAFHAVNRMAHACGRWTASALAAPA